ncbi:pitrilysin family protein [Planktotalea sp.]|uniref:M16 family metallopeptidase n=1 Tax=Planktotalea sp. TaxID=2029877 RepID=UPI003299FAE4
MRFGFRLAVPFLALLSAPIAAFAETVRWDDQVSTFSLDNGMDVVVIEDHRAPVVVHMMWYRAGSADEKPGVSGVAHFLEHLLFKATDNMEAGEFSRTVAANGGSDNAFTSYDYTAYFQRVASDRLELMMQMEADRMVNLRLSEADILTEREVIIEERNQRTENDPGALFNEQANAAMYMNHRYGVPIIGWRHEMETLDLQDAQDYYEQFYAPNNAILIVAGDVTPEDVKDMAERHYGPLEANLDLPERLRPQEPDHKAARRLVYEDPRVAQPYVSRAYLAPERDNGDQKTAAALMLAAELLGDGQTAFMTQRLQFEDKSAVYATAYYRGTSLDDTRFTTIVVPVPGVSLSEAEANMDRVLQEFLEEPIDTAHLDRIKRNMRAQEIFAKDNVQGLANRYGRALTTGLTIKDVLDWPDVVDSVNEDDIKTALRDVLQERTSVTGWLTSDAEAAK